MPARALRRWCRVCACMLLCKHSYRSLLLRLEQCTHNCALRYSRERSTLCQLCLGQVSVEVLTRQLFHDRNELLHGVRHTSVVVFHELGDERHCFRQQIQVLLANLIPDGVKNTEKVRRWYSQPLCRNRLCEVKLSDRKDSITQRLRNRRKNRS